MGNQIKTAYAELFDTYPNASQQADERLVNFFRSKTSAGDRVVQAQTATFKTLCEFADFVTVEIAPSRSREVTRESIPSAPRAMASSQGLTINLNIQLQLPLTENSEIYDKIFQSLKKNIITTE